MKILILSLLFLSLAADVYQYIRLDHLRNDTQKQVGDLKEQVSKVQSDDQAIIAELTAERNLLKSALVNVPEQPVRAVFVVRYHTLDDAKANEKSSSVFTGVTDGLLKNKPDSLGTIKTLNGQTYENVMVTGVNDIGITCTWTGGQGFLDFAALDDGVRKKYSYLKEWYDKAVSELNYDGDGK